MASTSDMAPGRTTAATTTGGTTPTPRTRAARSSNGATPRRRNSVVAASNEQRLESQIERLQADVKAIAASLGRIGSERVEEAQGLAKREYKHLIRQGEQVLEHVGDEFEAVERQLKDTIRQRPLTAVLSAMGIGFLIALLTR